MTLDGGEVLDGARRSSTAIRTNSLTGRRSTWARSHLLKELRTDPGLHDSAG